MHHGVERLGRDLHGEHANDLVARVVDAVEKLTFAWSTFDTEARKTLRGLYVEGNRFPAKDRDRLDDAGDGSYYSLYHRDFHDWAKRFRKSSAVAKGLPVAWPFGLARPFPPA